MLSKDAFAGKQKILAISGGIDSIVLLHAYTKIAPKHELTVAHFNHGTRPSADDDEAFVRARAEECGLKFVSERVNLGPTVSESDARAARYDFLHRVARDVEESSVIVTAHHIDDMIESIAINLLRGTGWRGLTPMMPDLGLYRPFIESGLSRSDIYEIACREKLAFRLDPTNQSDQYLRNRVRAKLETMPPFLRSDLRQKLLELYRKQVKLRLEIGQNSIANPAVRQAALSGSFPREVLVPSGPAEIELLRAFLKLSGVTATLPQLGDILASIRTLEPGKRIDLPGPDRKFLVVRKHHITLEK